MPLINRCGGGGGTPQLCGQVENFKVLPGTTALTAVLSWTAPSPDEDNSFVGARIVRKTGSAPTGINDGTVVYEGTALTYTDTGLTAGTTYYYRAFAYNDKQKYQTEYRVVSLVATTLTMGATLNDSTWAQIRAVSDAGLASSFWSVGDIKTITLKKLYIHYVSTGANTGRYENDDLIIDAFIIGFDHNVAVEGAKRIHFKIGKQEGKQVGLYSNANITAEKYEFTDSEVLAAMPADLSAVLKETPKYTYSVSSTNRIENVKLCSMAPVEVFGENGGWYADVGNNQLQYDYYKAGNPTLHFLNNGMGINWSTGYKKTGSVRLRGARSNYRYEIDNSGMQKWTDVKYSDLRSPIFFV